MEISRFSNRICNLLADFFVCLFSVLSCTYMLQTIPSLEIDTYLVRTIAFLSILILLFLRFLSFLAEVLSNKSKTGHEYGDFPIKIPALPLKLVFFLISGAFAFSFLKTYFEECESELLSGARFFLNSVLTEINNYYGAALTFPHGFPDQLKVFLLLVIPLLYAFLLLLRSLTNKRLFVVFPPVLVLIFLMMVGRTPSYKALLLLLLAVLILLLARNLPFLQGSFTLRKFLQPLAVVLFFAFLLGISYPLFSKPVNLILTKSAEIKAFQTTLENNLTHLGQWNITSPIAPLGNTPPSFETTEVMTITLPEKPTETFYTRCAAYYSYENGTWVHRELYPTKALNGLGLAYAFQGSELPEVTILAATLFDDWDDSSDINEYRKQAGNLLKQYLSNTCTYSLKLDSVPPSTDALSYFLSDSHKGFCDHFATAGTLILQTAGIPARYVTGYMTQPADYTRNEDGTYSTTILDDSGHAWTEIYLENQGWVVWDMTPPSAVLDRKDDTSEGTDSNYSDATNLHPDASQEAMDSHAEDEQNSIDDESLDDSMNSDSKEESAISEDVYGNLDEDADADSSNVTDNPSENDASPPDGSDKDSFDAEGYVDGSNGIDSSKDTSGNMGNGNTSSTGSSDSFVNEVSGSLSEKEHFNFYTWLFTDEDISFRSETDAGNAGTSSITTSKTDIDAPKKISGSVAIQILKWFLRIFLLLLLLAALGFVFVVSYRFVSETIRHRLFNRLHVLSSKQQFNKGARLINKKYLQYLRHNQFIPLRLNTDEDLYTALQKASAAEKIPLTQQEVREYMRIAKQATYSKTEITAEEYAFLLTVIKGVHHEKITRRSP